MGKAEKLRAKLFSNPAPKDFTWDELTTLLTSMYDFRVENGNGSRRKFIQNGTNIVISLHKPHPGNILKEYVVKIVVNTTST